MHIIMISLLCPVGGWFAGKRMLGDIVTMEHVPGISQSCRVGADNRTLAGALG